MVLRGGGSVQGECAGKRDGVYDGGEESRTCEEAGERGQLDGEGGNDTGRSTFFGFLQIPSTCGLVIILPRPVLNGFWLPQQT